MENYDDQEWDDTLDGEGDLDTTWEEDQEPEQDQETLSNESSVTLSSKASSSKRSFDEVEPEEGDVASASLGSPGIFILWPPICVGTELSTQNRRNRAFSEVILQRPAIGAHTYFVCPSDSRLVWLKPSSSFWMVLLTFSGIRIHILDTPDIQQRSQTTQHSAICQGYH